MTSRWTSTASWMRSPSSANSFGEARAAVALRACGDARQQVIDGGDERGDFRLVALQIDAALQPSADGDALQLLRKLARRSRISRRCSQYSTRSSVGDEREEKAQQPDDRHLEFLMPSASMGALPRPLVIHFVMPGMRTAEA